MDHGRQQQLSTYAVVNTVEEVKEFLDTGLACVATAVDPLSASLVFLHTRSELRQSESRLLHVPSCNQRSGDRLNTFP